MLCLECRCVASHLHCVYLSLDADVYIYIYIAGTKGNSIERGTPGHIEYIPLFSISPTISGFTYMISITYVSYGQRPTIQADICTTSLIYSYSLHEACDVAYASPRRRSSHLCVVTLTVADVHVYIPLTVADVYVYNLLRLPPHSPSKTLLKSE